MRRLNLVLSIVAPQGIDLADASALLDALGIARPPLLTVDALGVRESVPESRLGFVGGESGEGGAGAQQPTRRTAMHTNVMRAFDGTSV